MFRSTDTPSDRSTSATNPGEMSTDEELAIRARSGSLPAFEALVRRYQVPLLSFLRRRSPHPGAAEDILQEAFMRAYRSLDRYDDARPFRTWLFTLAYRLAVSAARRHSLRWHQLPADAACNTTESPGRPMERAESVQKIWGTARRLLADEHFSVLWLHYGQGMPVEQIGAVLGRGTAWVKTNLHRSRRKLAGHLADQQEYPSAVYAPAAAATR